MHTYLMLLHHTPADEVAMSADEMRAVVARYQAWAGDLAARGLLLGGEKLVDDGGRVIRLDAGRPVATDGPYAEAHDVVGGYFLIGAADDAGAERLAATCPHLTGRQWIEVRRIEPM